MAFEVGNAGRPKGALNKISTKVADKLDKIGIDLINDLNERYLKALEDKNEDRAITILLSMMPYVYPKLKMVEYTNDDHFKGMSPEQKLEALKQAVRLLEAEVKK